MAFRGRGRGRGGFGGGGGFGFRAAKQVPFELFPEIKELGTAKKVEEFEEQKPLVIWYSKFQKYCNSSPYYLEDENEASGKTQRTEIERYSDRKSEKTRIKPPLSHFIRMEPNYVPAELAKGEKKEKRGVKRMKWTPDADMQKLDIFEKLEQKFQGVDGKEDEEEEEDENIEEDEQEYSDDGDYNQNRDFDDDEDDFNMADDNDDEPIF